ncbi:unnamed protein product [Litomosoides sigmodontis]|uniref:Uncharacterized protein n=1 Tax=Litomosoides sigmodontis TaxID=42156 RepID=A0A3P6SCC5_LITSI|nr:unnamed protein product [Litomosoides sigmodontis]
MFLLTVLFVALLLLYMIYGLLDRKLTMSEIDRKAVLITGCGSGFGRDLVGRCLQNGLTVFAGCKFESNLNDLEESYGSVSQGGLYAFHMDVTDDESVRKSKKIVDSILQERNLVLHAVINNAGIRGNQFYDDFLVLDDYKEVWDVNVYGVIRVTHAFRSLIKKSRYELEPFGVFVTVLFPGSFQTGLHVTEDLHEMVDVVWNRSSQEIRNEYGNDFNMKAKAFVDKTLSKLLSKDTTRVIDTYYEAIVAKRPKLSYRIGWDASFICVCKFTWDLELQNFYASSLFQLLSLFIPAAMGTVSSYEDFNEMV